MVKIPEDRFGYMTRESKDYSLSMIVTAGGGLGIKFALILFLTGGAKIGAVISHTSNDIVSSIDDYIGDTIVF